MPYNILYSLIEILRVKGLYRIFSFSVRVFLRSFEFVYARLKAARGSLPVLVQAAAVEEGLAAVNALLRPSAVVPHVEMQVGLFRVTGAALAAGIRPALLKLVTGRPRVPIAEGLLMALQVAAQDETFATVFAIVLSLRIAPSDRFRESLCNIINHSSITLQPCNSPRVVCASHGGLAWKITEKYLRAIRSLLNDRSPPISQIHLDGTMGIQRGPRVDVLRV